MMAVIGIVGLAIGVGIGLWVAMAKIAKPLVGLGDRMSTLAQASSTPRSREPNARTRSA
jgi:hypothetical protein